jgi:hypothetical protein
MFLPENSRQANHNGARGIGIARTWLCAVKRPNLVQTGWTHWSMNIGNLN